MELDYVKRLSIVTRVIQGGNKATTGSTTNYSQIVSHVFGLILYLSSFLFKVFVRTEIESKDYVPGEL